MPTYPASTSPDDERVAWRQWAEQHRYVDGETLRQQLGLSPEEWQAATFFDRVIPRVKLPDDLYARFPGLPYPLYHDDIQLSAADRAKIADATHLTKTQACTRLKISARTFDRWKRATGLTHVVLLQYGNSYPVYGYRQSDVDRLPNQVQSLRNRTRKP